MDNTNSPKLQLVARSACEVARRREYISISIENAECFMAFNLRAPETWVEVHEYMLIGATGGFDAVCANNLHWAASCAAMESWTLDKLLRKMTAILRSSDRGDRFSV